MLCSSVGYSERSTPAKVKRVENFDFGNPLMWSGGVGGDERASVMDHGPPLLVRAVTRMETKGGYNGAGESIRSAGENKTDRRKEVSESVDTSVLTERVGDRNGLDWGGVNECIGTSSVERKEGTLGEGEEFLDSCSAQGID